MAAHTNRLIQESSPYLLQHAHNPVDWYPWGPEALHRALTEDKPILVSIGYSACHWCHVMERESFEDPETASLMNRHFINIKIDREERPDLDHIYMDAVQAMTGKGGWPLNVFLTPDTRPFFGGTYFPPRPAYSMKSWRDILQGVAQSFAERRPEIEEQARRLTEYLESSNRLAIPEVPAAVSGRVFPADLPSLIGKQLLSTADTEDGGFGNPPKFPQTQSIRFLLHYYYHFKEERALQQAVRSLDRMIYGGIYDQVGGGFARYATDKKWLIPHFEKMLYDNALLIGVLSEAYQLQAAPRYKRVIEETIAFVEAEWLSPEGGFYAAYDADSEGVEGRYYVWSHSEIRELLGADATLFCAYFDITPGGNWEGTSILHVPVPPDDFAQQWGVSAEALDRIIGNALGKLRAVRSHRVKPLLDDKILLGWNALMIQALGKAYAALGEERYLDLARRAEAFVWRTFFRDDCLYHGYKNGQVRNPAFLDDYAYLIQALLQLQEVTGIKEYLEKARQLTERVIRDFSDPAQHYFYYTGAGQQDVIVRKKELYDGATPSGNAVMATNLTVLGVLFDRPEWRERAVRMVRGMQPVIEKYPGSFGAWAVLLQGMAQEIPEIALVGHNFNHLLKVFLRIFIPLKIVQAGDLPDENYPLLSGKPNTAHAQFYLCKEYRCLNPVSEVESLLRLLA